MINIVYDLKTLILNIFVFKNKYEVLIYLAVIIYAFPIIRSQFKFVNKAINKIKNNQKKIIIGFGLTYLLISSLGSLYFHNLENAKDRINLHSDIAKLTTIYSNTIILTMPGVILMEDLDPYNYYVLNKWSNLKIIGNGWSTFSPRFYDNIKKILQIDNGYEILPKLLEENNFILIANDNYASYLSTFVSQHYQYDNDLLFVPIDTISPAIIYKPVWIDRFKYNSCKIKI